MRLREIVWTPEIADKVRGKHGLRPEEIEQVCLDPASHLRRARDGRHAVLGRTEAGRYVLVCHVPGNRTPTVPTNPDPLSGPYLSLAVSVS